MVFNVEPYFWAFWLSPAALGILGACIGSFLNVVILRLPRMLEQQWVLESAAQLSDADTISAVAGMPASEATRLAKSAEMLGRLAEAAGKTNLTTQSSKCPHCGHKLRWRENLPIVGWLMLRGKCGSCGAPIAIRYLLIELATMTAFAALGWRFGHKPATLLWCGFSAALIALAMIDWDTFLLPDSITQPLMWAGLAAAALGWSTVPLTAAFLGATAGYLSLCVVATAYEKVRGQDGMAPGDFKFLGAVGAWLGWQSILPVIIGASILGVLWGAASRTRRTTGGSADGQVAYPFGPFLAGASLAVMFIGPARVMGWIG